MKKIEINHLLDFQFPSAPAFSADGKTIAFVVQRASLEENKYPGDLWLLDVETKALRRLTDGGDARSFLWTKHGTLLFPAMRDSALKKNGALSAWYEISPDGGEAALAFTLPIKAKKLSPVDDDRYIVTASFQNPDSAARETRTQADCDVLEETPFWANGNPAFTSGLRTRLYLYTRSTGELKPITDPWFDTISYTLRGSRLLYKGMEWHDAKNRRDHEGFLMYDLESGETRTVREPDHMRHNIYVMWDEDTALVSTADNSAFDRMSFPNFCTMDLGSGQLTPLAALDATANGNTITADARLGGGITYKLVGDRFYFITTDGDHGPLKYIDKTGHISAALTPNGAADSFDIHGENTIVCGQFGQRLSELYLNGEQVTFFNEDWYREHSISVPEYHSFIASDGFEIHGWAMKPIGYEPGRKYPAILHIHGGPRTAFSDIYHHEMQLWANAGYFVIFCNPRGSDGRGSEFGYIRGLYGNEEYRNVMDFTDEMIRCYPDIDEAKMAVVGGSHGGFMTNWVIGHTNRFAAAVSQRSISNWVTFEYISDIGYYYVYGQQGATTQEDVEKLWELSPLRYAHQCTTPTLFIHSDQDYRCPMGEGLSMFTALKNSGCDARLVLFHGENHELSRSGKPRNRIRRMEEILAWLDKYLK